MSGVQGAQAHDPGTAGHYHLGIRHGRDPADGKVYVDPPTGKPVDQSQPGEEQARDGSKGYAEYHTVRAVEPPRPKRAFPWRFLRLSAAGPGHLHRC